MVMDPLVYNEVRTRPSLEERLESIISGAALMADSSCTRDERRERIVAECNAVRQALQDLLSEYMSNVSTLFLNIMFNYSFDRELLLLCWCLQQLQLQRVGKRVWSMVFVKKNLFFLALYTYILEIDHAINPFYVPFLFTVM